VASLSQGRTAAAQCGLFTHKSVPVIFEPPCICTTTLQRNVCILTIWLLYTTSAVYESDRFGFMRYYFVWFLMVVACTPKCVGKLTF